MPFQNRLDGFEHLVNGLVELRLMRVPAVDLLEDLLSYAHLRGDSLV